MNIREEVLILKAHSSKGAYVYTMFAKEPERGTVSDYRKDWI